MRVTRIDPFPSLDRATGLPKRKLATGEMRIEKELSLATTTRDDERITTTRWTMKG